MCFHKHKFNNNTLHTAMTYILLSINITLYLVNLFKSTPYTSFIWCFPHVDQKKSAAMGMCPLNSFTFAVVLSRKSMSVLISLKGFLVYFRCYQHMDNTCFISKCNKIYTFFTYEYKWGQLASTQPVTFANFEAKSRIVASHYMTQYSVQRGDPG